jgi:hypothetical protein
MAAEQTMKCLEVWGGNEPVNSAVALSGLDAWVYSQPYSDATSGGDVYFASSCATGRIARLLVADVSGHGAAVSEMGIKLRTLMRRYVNYRNQRNFVRQLNEQFTTVSDSATFATALAFTFYAPTRELTLSNAGHPPPLIYRVAEKRWHYIDRALGAAGDIPWGIDEVTDYSQASLRMNPGDLVLCYTDFLPEARKPDGAFLGQQGLLALVSALDVSTPSQLIPSLLQAVASAGYATDDDVTAMLFRATGKARHAPVIRMVGGYLSTTWAMLTFWYPGRTAVPWPDLEFPPLTRYLAARRAKRPIPAADIPARHA